MDIAPFSPQNTSITVSATGANSSTTLPVQGTPVSVVRIINAGPGTAFFNFTTGAGTATVAASCPVLANTIEVFSKPIGADTFNVISASTSTVYVTPGEGV